MTQRSQLFDELYQKLLGLARNRLAYEDGPGNATSLVHEAYLKLRGWAESFQNEQHFLGTASNAMRQILVDRARHRLTQKRNAEVEPLSVSIVDEAQQAPNVIEVLLFDELLRRLEEFDARAAQVMEMRVFLGLTVEEVAADLGISARTVKREWAIASAWLKAELAQERNKKSGD